MNDYNYSDNVTTESFVAVHSHKAGLQSVREIRELLVRQV